MPVKFSGCNRVAGRVAIPRRELPWSPLANAAYLAPTTGGEQGAAMRARRRQTSSHRALRERGRGAASRGRDIAHDARASRRLIGIAQTGKYPVY
eukprot:364500-Chlamydomonas_euryale.AAC.14